MILKLQDVSRIAIVVYSPSFYDYRSVKKKAPDKKLSFSYLQLVTTTLTSDKHQNKQVT